MTLQNNGSIHKKTTQHDSFYNQMFQIHKHRRTGITRTCKKEMGSSCLTGIFQFCGDEKNSDRWM